MMVTKAMPPASRSFAARMASCRVCLTTFKMPSGLRGLPWTMNISFPTIRTGTTERFVASLPQNSSRAPSFKRVPQNGGHLPIQHLEPAAKLQLFVRYHALHRDFNDNRQYVTDERRRENRGDQRSKVRSNVPNNKTCDGSRHPDNGFKKRFHQSAPAEVRAVHFQLPCLQKREA